MKRLFTLLFGILLIAAPIAAQESQPEISFDKYVHDYGTIYEENGPVTCTFTDKTTGTANLVIHQVVASCGCTQPDYSKEPLRPGEEATLTVTYDGSGKSPGSFVKRVTLRTNCKESIVVLNIKGTMIGAAKE